MTSTSDSAARRPFSDWTPARARAAAASVPMAVWVFALVVVSTISRFLLARGVHAPFIFQDELLYSELGKSFGSTGHFALRDVPGLAGLSPVYPILISPAYALFDPLPDAYTATKLLNSVYMSLAAIPAYLIARRLVSAPLALLAAVLVLAVPDLLLTGAVMTENAFYPLFLLWFLVLVRMLERPTVVNQVVLLLLVALAYETRPQAIMLVPALLTALAVVVAADVASAERPRNALVERLTGYWLTLALVAGGAVLYALVEGVLRGHALKQSLLKTYAVLGNTQYTFGGVAKWTLYLVGELDIVVGVLPFAAFVVVVAAGLGRQWSTPAIRAFAAGALAATIWIFLAVGAFSSTPYAQRIEERNDFYVMPLLLIALVVWAARYANALPRATAIGTTIAVAATGLVPVAAFLTPHALTDSFGLLVVWRPQIHWAIPNEWLTPLIVLIAIGAGIFFLLLPARFALAAPLVVLAFLAFGNREADMFLSTASRDSRNGGIQAPVDWIDRAVGSDAEVAALFTNARPPTTVWQNEFFNRSVGTLYNFVSGNLDGLPQKHAVIDRKTGFLKVVGDGVVRAQYALVDNTQELAGPVVASDPGIGMRVYRADGPVRVLGSITGTYPDMWSGATASILAYACTGGQLQLVLAGEPRLHQKPVTVVASSGGKRLAKLVVPPGFAERSYSIPLVSTGDVCQVDFAVHPLAVPAERLNSLDTRALGIRFVRFDVQPKP